MSDNQQVQSNQPVTSPAPDSQEPVSVESKEPDSTISALPTDNPAPVPELVSDVSAASSFASIEPISPVPSVAEGTIPADSSQVSADSLTQSSPPVEEPASADPVDSPSEPNLPTSSTDTIPSPIPPPDLPVDSPVVVSEASPGSNLSTPSDLSDIPISNILPLDQVSQVPSAPPDNTPGEILEKSENKEVPEPVSEPEVPESPTVPSILPQSSSVSSPATTFGDILAGNTTPTTPPPAPPSPDLSTLSNPSDLSSANPFTSPKPDVSGEGGQPSTSFGDLLNKTVIPDPSINIESIKPPAPPPISSPPSNSQPISPQPSHSSLSPISPTIDSSDLQKQLDEKLKSELDVRRQKANQVRVAKHQKILDKLVALVEEKGKLTSEEAQIILRLPQSTLYDDFHLLVKKGLIKQFGKDRGTYYTL